MGDDSIPSVIIFLMYICFTRYLTQNQQPYSPTAITLSGSKTSDTDKMLWLFFVLKSYVVIIIHFYCSDGWKKKKIPPSKIPIETLARTATKPNKPAICIKDQSHFAMIDGRTEPRLASTKSRLFSFFFFYNAHPRGTLLIT